MNSTKAIFAASIVCFTMIANGDAFALNDTADAVKQEQATIDRLTAEKNKLQLEKDIKDLEKQIDALSYPTGKPVPKEGIATIENIGSLGVMMAMKASEGLAVELCQAINRLPGRPVLVNETTFLNDLRNALLLEHQAEFVLKILKKATSNDASPPVIVFSLPAVIPGILGVVSTFADFTRLANTDRTIKSSVVADGRAIFKNLMLKNCRGSIASVSDGYLGELTFVEEAPLVQAVRSIVSVRLQLGSDIRRQKDLLEKIKADEKNAPDFEQKKTVVESTIGQLEQTAKYADNFIEGVKPFDFTGGSTLAKAVSILMYYRHVIGENPRILDLSVAMDSLTVTRSNPFFGTKIGVGGATLVHYRLSDIHGKVIHADVLTRAVKPAELEIRTQSASHSVWHNEEPITQSETTQPGG